ncbi:LysR family transcriptional regulator [Bermanella marisrubri]|uniref:Probable transcriptional regulator n=1 Tax=Bermanella marisrubri TaxID=207949 RepID=Q1N5V1_9GAMM|nr:LysR family transcriptional regulator [Bermanella marisrubri]EAT13841.1 probable transcriptional regulator [Oceanobacter sp. RED65] [Bermanella marisrubri]QIZ84603.1 LysR family transcriptional regulator [Bermanella marisrubri]
MNQFHQLDLNLLRVFDALMRERSVSLAAQQLFLSQSATSHALNRLREALNDPLLVRTPSGMMPSEFAERITPQIRQALAQLQTALEQSRDFTPKISQRRFVVHTTDYVECVVLPPLIAKLKREAPGVGIEVGILSKDLPLEELATGDVDLLLGFSNYMDFPKQLNQETWWQDELVALANPQFHNDFAKHKALTLSQVVETPHVFHSPLGERQSVIDHWLQSKKQKRTIAVTSQSYFSAAAIVSSAPYLMVIPKRVANQLSKALPLRVYALPLDAPKAHLNFVYHPIKQQDPGLKWLIDEIKATATQ